MLLLRLRALRLAKKVDYICSQSRHGFSPYGLEIKGTGIRLVRNVYSIKVEQNDRIMLDVFESIHNVVREFHTGAWEYHINMAYRACRKNRRAERKADEKRRFAPYEEQ